MKLTYEVTVRSVDNRGRIRFEEVEPKEGEKPTNPEADLALGLRYEEDAKHGFIPGQKIRVTIEG